MKQFIKALDKDGNCYKYICETFPRVSGEKLKAGVFDGPQIRRLLNDSEFENSMRSIERDAWEGFRSVVQNFLGNHKAANYGEIVSNMLSAFQKLGCRMSVKLHLLHAHLSVKLHCLHAHLSVKLHFLHAHLSVKLHFPCSSQCKAAFTPCSSQCKAAFSPCSSQCKAALSPCSSQCKAAFTPCSSQCKAAFTPCSSQCKAAFSPCSSGLFSRESGWLQWGDGGKVLIKTMETRY